MNFRLLSCAAVLALCTVTYAADEPFGKSRRGFIAGMRAAAEGDCGEAEDGLDDLDDDYPVQDLLLLETAKCHAARGNWHRGLKYADKAMLKAPAGSPAFNDIKLTRAFLLARDDERKDLEGLIFQLPRPESLEDEELLRYFEILRYYTDGFSVLKHDEKIAALDARLLALLRGLYLNLLADAADEPLKQMLGLRRAEEIWKDDLFIKEQASSHFARKDYRTALDTYKRYYERTTDPSVLGRLSRVSKLLGDAANEETYLRLTVDKAINPYEKRQALLQLGRYYWNKNRNAEARRSFMEVMNMRTAKNDLNQEAVHACYLYGRVAEADNDFDAAEKSYARVLAYDARDDFFVRKKLESLLRIAWVAYRQKQWGKAWTWFSSALREDRVGVMADEIRFWMGMTLWQQGQPQKAAAQFKTVAFDYPHSYYGMLARRRLAPESRPNLVEPVAVEAVAATPQYSVADQVWIKRYDELAATQFYKLASDELAQLSWNGRDGVQLQDISRRFAAVQDIFSSLRVAKFSVSYDERRLAATWMPYLFPLPPYWDKLQRYAMLSGIDPYLVLALIRQESEFRDKIVSHADAYGIMQILPTLAREIAKDLGLKTATTKDLYEPTINMRLGIYHLGYLMRRYNDNLIYSFAAYNGSEGAVARWRGRLEKAPDAEFVEEITYGETKHYVKTLLRNYVLYQAVRERLDASELLP